MRELVPVERLDIVEGEWSVAGPPALPLPTLEELVERFLVGHDVRAMSRATYRRQLREFTKWVGEEGLRLTDVRREHVLGYREYLEKRAGAAGEGLSSYSVAGYLTAVRRLFTWLEAERIYPNVARGVKGPKRPRGHKKDILTEEQLRSCLEAIAHDPRLGEHERARNYALFNLMARTGLRDIEAARASYGNMRRMEGERVLYVQGKGRDEADEFVLLTPKAYKPLRAYLDRRIHGQLDARPYQSFQGIRLARRRVQPGEHVRRHRGDLVPGVGVRRPLLESHGHDRAISQILSAPVCRELQDSNARAAR